jgi:hypothetical protein
LADAAADLDLDFPFEPASVPRSTVRLRFKAAMRSITFCRDGGVRAHARVRLLKYWMIMSAKNV